MSTVCLIYPPLIASSFGSFYPSTAVLSAFLKKHGIDTVQEDLNEAFADFLLEDLTLRELGAGRVPRVRADSLIAAAARWAGRNRHRLFDERGRRFRAAGRAGEEHDYSYVLDLLGLPFFVEAGAEEMRHIDRGRHPVDTYVEFFEWTRIAARLPADTALIGISVPMGPQLLPALLLAGRLKTERPDVPVVFGGPTLSLMDPADIETLLSSHRDIDCVVRFDGEFPLLELSRQALAGTWDPGAVSAVSYRDGDAVRHNDPAPGPDVTDLPPPDYPPQALARLAQPVLGITQARGCYWGKCDYCDFVELFDGSPPFRGRHPAEFVDEMQWLIDKTGIRHFYFITESIPPTFARRTSELLLQRGVRAHWNSFAMVDRRFDRDLLALMVEAGCDNLVIGMETTNTRTLKLVHKSADREENLRFLRDARDVGMRLIVNLIPDLPSTTYEEAMASLADIQALADCFQRVSVFPFEATRSSNVGRHPERFGLIQGAGTPHVSHSQYALNQLDSVDPAMSAEQRAEVHRRYRRFAEDVNHREKPARRLEHADPHSPMRVSVEEIDMFSVADRHLVVTHFRDRRRITVRGEITGMLEPHLDGRPFLLPVLSDGRDEHETRSVIRGLSESGVLVHAGSRPNGLVAGQVTP